MSERLAPAQTYELNMLASAIGRFAVPNIDATTICQANELTDKALQRLTDADGPEVPSTMPELIGQSAAFDEKLRDQLLLGPASELADERLLAAAHSAVSAHLDVCDDLLTKKASHEQLVDPGDIADRYGLPNMWRDATSVLNAEIATWGEQTQHPSVPPYLARLVSEAETKELINFIWEDILMIDHELDSEIYTTLTARDYHLFWVPTSSGLDYATPSNYDRATQLSFDLPHNVAHLAHLSARKTIEGAHRFTDRMEERAYFEAVAVLSEYIMAQTCSQQPERVERMLDAYGMTSDDSSVSSLSRWIVEDRKYEFKLRAARLYADVLATQGAPFGEIVSEVSVKLGLSNEATAAEAKKYLPWTGLGAVYTMGYRALLESGVSTVSDAIRNSSGPVTTWAQFNRENSGDRSVSV